MVTSIYRVTSKLKGALVSLFRLDASIMPATSASRELADVVEEHWRASHPAASVQRRHLGADPLPADAWAAAVTGSHTPAEQRTDAQREALALAAELVAELEQADAVLLAVPLYNFGISQHVKTWMDLVIAGAGRRCPSAGGQARRPDHGPRRRVRRGNPARGLGPLHRLPAPHPRGRLGRRPDRRRARVHPRRGQPGARRVHGPRRRAARAGAGCRRGRRPRAWPAPPRCPRPPERRRTPLLGVAATP